MPCFKTTKVQNVDLLRDLGLHKWFKNVIRVGMTSDANFIEKKKLKGICRMLSSHSSYSVITISSTLVF